VLAVAPGRVITTKGNERTAEAMVKNGIEIVDTIDFSEINRGNGSIHCGTQPIVREYE
jgi:arginine deiminase